jgi:cytochrome c
MKKLCLVLLAACLPIAVYAEEMDKDTAYGILKKNNCLKCHSIDKKKDGPAYRDVAKKYKGKPDAEAKLFKHVTTGPKVKLEDGSEEEHKIIKTDSDEQTRALIRWILSL